MDHRLDTQRTIRAQHGNQISTKSWQTEAAKRMLMNNLDPDVAEHPQALVVYGGIGRAARDWPSYDKIIATLERLDDDETLLVQSGKPVGVFKTHSNAPRVLIANSNLVPHWANWEHFNELDKKRLDDVRPNDRWLLDLYRFSRDCSRHLRNLCSYGKTTFFRRCQR